MKFEIHCHSSFSDGLNTVKEMLLTAKELGLDGICITDHDTMDEYEIERRLARSMGLKTMRGVEVTTPIGHVLVYGINKVPIPFEIEEFLEAVKKRGGISVLAHPYYSAFHEMKGELAENLIKKFDAVEVINGGVTPEQNLFAIHLAKKYKMPGTGGSDAHIRGSIGKVAVEFEDFANDVRSGHVKIVSDDPEIRKLIRVWER